MDCAGAVPVVRSISINRHGRHLTDPSMDMTAASAAAAIIQNGKAVGSAGRRHTLSIHRHINRKASGSPPLMEGSGSGRSMCLPQRPCPCARVVQFSVKTALHLPSTQLALCPNPLRKKLFFHAHRRGGASEEANNSRYRMDENGLDFYPEAPSFGEEEEEFSSGDEDDFCESAARRNDSEDSPPTGIEGEALSSFRVGLAGEETSGKLAFGRRKLKFFDQVTAQDREEARSHLKSYWREVHKRQFHAKLHHLQRGSEDDMGTLYDAEQDAGVGEVDLPVLTMVNGEHRDGESAAASGTVRNELAAALILESLTFCPEESVEGMAECYDGLVAAGAALLEHAERESRASPTAVSGASESQSATDILSSDASKVAKNDGSNGPLSVLSTLTPLLITTLEPMSGEVILLLSQVYNLCATTRYKRRLIHRIAPHLIRPANAALWCLKHQNDMPAIMAVTELLLERAGEIFSPNWVERGKFLKADGLRAESLRLAALQLKNLNSKKLGLHTLSISGSKGVAGGTGSNSGGTVTGTTSHAGSDNDHSHLAEWEVLAVDRYIRTSISHVFERMWVNLKVSKPSSRGLIAGSGTVTSTSSVVSVSSGAGVGGGGCPMSPRKIPLSPSTFPNASSNANSASASLPQVESVLAPTGGNLSPSGLPPTSASAASGNSNDVPQTPKPPPLTAATSAPSVGTPPRSPCSPPKSSRSITPSSSAAAEIIMNAPQLPIMNGPSTAQSSTQYAPSSSSTPSSRKSHQHPSQKQHNQLVVHHTLTKNSEERKRTVAACRALRAQIARFEENFATVHGRPPKGATERAPLATTYAQYREWKRAIRADAATRIQALFRGARCRWMLLRSSSPRLSRVVRRSGSRTGRGLLGQLSIPVEIGGEVVDDGHGGSRMVDVVGMGGGGFVHGGHGGGMRVNLDVEERSCQSTEGVELVITPTGGISSKRHSRDYGRSGGKLSSPPGSSGVGWHLGRMRKGGNKRDGLSADSHGIGDNARTHLLSPNSMDTYTTASMTMSSASGQGDNIGHGKNNYHAQGGSMHYPKKQSKYSRIRNSTTQGGHHYPYTSISGGSSVDSDNNSDESHSSRGSFSNSGSTGGSGISLGDVSLQDLLTQKRELKAQLKSYDMNFARKHGRMPVKAEKEPIRHLYEQYNSLKAHISLLESAAAASSSVGSGGLPGDSGVHVHPSARATTSSTSSKRSGSSVSLGSSDRSVESSEDESSSSRGQNSSHSRRRDRSRNNNNGGGISSQNHFGMVDAPGYLDPSSIVHNMSSGNSLMAQDLSALRAEKGTLHQMLRSYEREFFREHNRQVSSFADIRPVAAQYRRYKEIKKAIAALQAAEK